MITLPASVGFSTIRRVGGVLRVRIPYLEWLSVNPDAECRMVWIHLSGRNEFTITATGNDTLVGIPASNNPYIINSDSNYITIPTKLVEPMMPADRVEWLIDGNHNLVMKVGRA